MGWDELIDRERERERESEGEALDKLSGFDVQTYHQCKTVFKSDLTWMEILCMTCHYPYMIL